jgi:hypothetical protein
LAGIFSATTCFASTVIVQFTHLPYTSGEGVYTGWSIATVNNVTNSLLMCDDDYHTTNMPSEFTYDYSDLGTDIQDNTMSNLEFGNAATNTADGFHVNSSYSLTVDYEAAAYLMYEYYLLQPTAPTAGTSAQSQTATDYNFAVWGIFNTTTSLTTTQQNLEAAAYSYVTNSANATFLMKTVYDQTVYYTPSNVSPANSGGQQEFGQYLGIPEPSPAWLLAAGLIALLAVRRAGWLRFANKS